MARELWSFHALSELTLVVALSWIKINSITQVNLNIGIHIGIRIGICTGIWIGIRIDFHIGISIGIQPMENLNRNRNTYMNPNSNTNTNLNTNPNSISIKFICPTLYSIPILILKSISMKSMPIDILAVAWFQLSFLDQVTSAGPIPVHCCQLDQILTPPKNHEGGSNFSHFQEITNRP